MTDRRFFSGNTLQQAVMKAAREFDIPPEALEYEQVEKKHGFLKIRRNVVIEVDPDNPRRVLSDEEALRRAQEIEPEVGVPPRRGLPERPEVSRRDTSPPRRKPEQRERSRGKREQGGGSSQGGERAGGSRERRRKPRRERGGGGSSEPRRGEQMIELPEKPGRAKEKYPPAEGETADAIKEALGILLAVTGAEMESSVLQGDDRYEIELWGPDQDLLLADDGRPLLGIQHLLVRVVRGLTGESIYCRVDCDQFHDIREERLRDMAQRIASDVQRRNRPKLLESMAPDERRIVHIALTDDPNVTTESIGRGYYKRVKIRPS